jgi:SAM-dependent methyltransferase
MNHSDIVSHNRKAWNGHAAGDCPWSTPVDRDTIEKAKRGDWSVILTPLRPVPESWFGDIRGKRLLCLASGGGQQAPVLAAAGAQVASFDNSDEQLAKDRLVAERDGLILETVRGDMADLSAFADDTFDLIFHPVANVFVPDVKVVWRECFRVLRPGGVLLSGFMNPSYYLFDHDEAEKTNQLQVKYGLPYSDATSLEPEQREKLVRDGVAFEFSHSLEAQIGGQLEAGFVITGFYEDSWTDEATPLNQFSPTTMATRAVKPDKNDC